MSAVQEQIEKLYTLQESFDSLANVVEVQIPALSDKIDNIQLPEIDTSTLAKETTLQEESAEIKNKIDNIDLSSVAKQGENADATNTAILKAVSDIVDTKNLYSVRFESNDDGPNTYTMVLPVVAGVVGDTIIL